MPRLKTIVPDAAQGQVKDVYQEVASTMGKVPKFVQTVANSPAALKAYLALDRELSDSSLSEPERHAVYLAASETNQCGYCTAAHCYLGKQSGLTDEDIAASRKGGGQSKVAALTDFVRAVMTTRGQISDDDWGAFRQAGYGDAAAAEVCAIIGQATFSNYLNRLNQTEIDFPAPASIGG